jgi:hypothetical protein
MSENSEVKSEEKNWQIGMLEPCEDKIFWYDRFIFTRTRALRTVNVKNLKRSRWPVEIRTVWYARKKPSK